MSRFTAINQTFEPATNFQKAKDISRSDARPGRITARQKAGVVSSDPQRLAKNKINSDSFSYNKSMPTSYPMVSTHGSFSEQAVNRGITTTDLQRDPDLPASHQTQEGSQHEAPVNATRQSPVSAMQIQRKESGGTRSQTANPRKRRNPIEKTLGDERLQSPHKKLKQHRTIAREENSSILRSTELSK